MKVRDNPGGRRAVRYFGTNQSQISKTLEKLSSGYRINRSADDAAGLAVSEKMRAQITGLGRARLNSEDGIKLIQTGEGALQEIQNMLDRANYMAIESANGTYENALDRENLQKELSHLRGEIDRIAKSAKFNTIELFQDDGVEFESSIVDPSAKEFQEEIEDIINSWNNQSAATLPSNTALDALLDGQEKGDLNIVYVEHDMSASSTSTSGTTGTTNVKLPDGTTADLGDILKKQIVPNIVQNVLSNYPAFSYLSGSSIGIGLEYFSEGAAGGSTTLAYVRGGVSASSTTGLNGSMTYTLGVNTAACADASGVFTDDVRSKLEATIAHEMIHAFMDEATTAGMFGKTLTSGGLVSSQSFPDWFIEGMAQTASGPGNWVSSSMGIKDNSTDIQINAAIINAKLGSGSTASQYGAGYLACMYLGAAIANGGTPDNGKINAQTISVGINRLLNEIIGGSSLNDAIKNLTGGKFSGYGDFETKFNNGQAAGMHDFIRGLITASSAGMGGLITGNLTGKDPADNADLNGVKLFELNTSSTAVKNIYPSNYPVYSGGSGNVSGTAPTDFAPAMPYIDRGNFLIYGALDSNIDYNPNGTVTIKAGSGIKVTMKDASAWDPALVNKLVIGDPNSNSTDPVSVTLDGVKLNTTAADSLAINNNVEITYENDNTFGGIKLESGANATFKGESKLAATSFTSDNSNTVTFQGGAVIVGSTGNGTIAAGNIIIDNAVVAANLTGTVKDSAGNTLQKLAVPWTGSPALDNLTKDITSVTFGSTTVKMDLPYNQNNAALWLDPNKAHSITFMDSDGNSKRLNAVQNSGTPPQLAWQAAQRPFAVSGGIEGTDWEYGGTDGNTLIIKTGTALTISGGVITEADGTQQIGRIQIGDASVTTPVNANLTLNGVTCEVTSGCAFDLGNGNNVTLNLSAGTTNTFTSGGSYAGISVGNGTKLTINGPGDLNATGGRAGATSGSSGGAGIGRSYQSGTTSTDGSSITITGGNITAAGGYLAAGIGAADDVGFGDITITGGNITANGAVGGAGIGGADDAKVGNISITDAVVTATSAGHGAGIGGGWGSSATNGTITIDGNSRITASSPTHGTGIGAGCSGNSGKITITGNTVIELAQGGDEGAGIGASWTGSCGNIEISGNAAIEEARGGNGGAGIGSGGSGSRATGTITIETNGTVNAFGGENGVGIGSGYKNSTIGNIEIKKGTVNATGTTDSTGIGAGRGSSSGNITIGDANNPNNTVVVTATGGMTNNGGNIVSYTDTGHTTAGTITITGDATSVQPGSGEGRYSTTGATDENGTAAGLYVYPLYLRPRYPDPSDTIDAGKELAQYTENHKNDTPPKNLLIPLGATITGISSSAGDTWSPNITHSPNDENYAYLWMQGVDQKLTVTYTDSNNTPGQIELDLKFDSATGTFRIGEIPPPKELATPPVYNVPDPVTPVNPPTPGDPGKGKGGIILQIGAGHGETLEVPRFYLSAKALGMDKVNISTQDNALNSMPVIQKAINRISSIRGTYGALQNRLEHNINSLSHMTENMTDAESRIRDADMAEEQMKLTRLNIVSQASQSMIIHSNQDASRVLQLVQG